MPYSIAYFISPHGFGHAARASAVMDAVHELDKEVCFEIFTTVPPGFFQESLSGPFCCHSFLTDVGLVQKSAFEENLSKTVGKLNSFLPFNPELTDNLSEKMKSLKCLLVICDIAPIGIVAARKAGIPSVLVENFTWDWIYEGYKERVPEINRHIGYLNKIFKEADTHIQAEPVCRRDAECITVFPVSRKGMKSRRETRGKLGIPDNSKAVLISTGGVPEEYSFSERLKKEQDTFFITANVGSNFAKHENLICLPQHSGFYHPDIVNASDAVVGKAGYSTLAEVFHAGIPFGYISRPDFREAEILARFIDNKMTGFEISEENFRSGDWVEKISDLLKMPGYKTQSDNGANQIAMYIKEQFLPH